MSYHTFIKSFNKPAASFFLQLFLPDFPGDQETAEVEKFYVS